MSRTQFPNKQPQPMPGNVRGALQKEKLMDAYLERPAYQKDDYLKWIATAAGAAAKQQRLDQMIEELKNGKLYKGEAWTPPEKVEAKPAAKAEAKPAAKAETKAAAKSDTKSAAKPGAKAADKAKPASPSKSAAKSK